MDRFEQIKEMLTPQQMIELIFLVLDDVLANYTWDPGFSRDILYGQMVAEILSKEKQEDAGNEQNESV